MPAALRQHDGSIVLTLRLLAALVSTLGPRTAASGGAGGGLTPLDASPRGAARAGGRAPTCEHCAPRAAAHPHRPARRPDPDAPPRSSPRGRSGSGPTTRTPPASPTPSACSRVGRVRRADGRPLPVLPPALRRPDAQAAAPGRGGRLPRGDARQPQQPRARRRPRGQRRSRSRSVEQLRVMFGLPAPGLGHLTSSGTIANLEALWVAREVHPGKRHRPQRRRALHARAHVRAARHDGHRRRARRAAGGSTSTPSRRECAQGRRRHGRPHRRLDRPRRHRPRRRGARAARALRRAPARRRRLRRLLHAAGARRGPARRARAVRRDRAVRLGRRRPPQARPAALRVRRGALRRPRGPARLPPRLALHLLHRGRPAPRRDQPRVLARGRRRRGAVAHAAGAAARRATRASAPCSRPGAARRSTGRSA